jgi:hypothetical protein
MFRFAANEHGWSMRVVEHGPVACVPSEDILRCLPINRLQTRWALRLQVYVPLTRATAASTDVHPRTKKLRPIVLWNLDMTAMRPRTASP